MSCLDDYIEKIHHLPLEVNRNLRLIQELDRRGMKAKDVLERLQEELKQSIQISGITLNNKKTYNFNDEQKRLIEGIDRCQTEYYHLSEEKCKIADQIYQEIQLCHDDLVNEKKRFLGENPSVKAAIQQQPIVQIPLQENELPPIHTKKKKKNDEKKAQKIKDINDSLDSLLNSPSKNGNQGGSLNSSYQEGANYSYQYNQLNLSQNSQGHLQNGKLNSQTNIDSLKASKRLTKSKYASSNRQEEQKYCCGQKIDSSFIQCDSCQQWFHHSCVGMEQNYIPQEDWHCHKCKGGETFNQDNYSSSNISNVQSSKLAPSRTTNSSSVRKHSKISNN